jgi:hypothetical protein
MTQSATLTVGSYGLTTQTGAAATTVPNLSIASDQTWNIVTGTTVTSSGSFAAAGSGNITKTGYGTWNVSATGNTNYPGTITLRQGTINVGTSPWGNSTQALQVYGGIIDNVSGSAKSIGRLAIYEDFQLGTSASTSSSNITFTMTTPGGLKVARQFVITCLGSGTYTFTTLDTTGAAGIDKYGSAMLSLVTSPVMTGPFNIYAGTGQVTGTSTIAVLASGGGYVGPGNGTTTNVVVTVAGVAGSYIKSGLAGVVGTSIVGGIVFTNSTSKLIVNTNGTTGKSLITTTAAVALNSVTVDFDPTNSLNAGTYTILTASGGLSGSATQGVAPSGRTWSSLSVSGNNLVATFT